MEPKIDAYEEYVSQYARLVVEREEAGIEKEQIRHRIPVNFLVSLVGYSSVIGIL